MNRLYRAVLGFFLLFIAISGNLLADEHYDFTYPDRASLLNAGWDFMAKTDGAQRNTEQTTGAVVSYDQAAHPGVLRIPVDVGDLWTNLNDTRNTLFRNLPSDWASITLKLSFAPTQNYQHVAFLLYQDDDNYAGVYRIYHSFNGGDVIESAHEIGGNGIIDQVHQETAVSDLYLRLSRNSNTAGIIADYSVGGSNWINLGTLPQFLKNPRLAIIAGASPSGFPNADLASVHIATGYSPPPSLSLYPRNIVFKKTVGPSNPSPQIINVLSRSLVDFNWNATPNATWIDTSPLNGSTPGTMNVGVKTSETSGLSPGVYSSFVTVNAGTDGTQQLGVNLIVNPDAPVSVSTWKDGHKGAVSATTDDSQTSCYSTELANSKGSFYLEGTDFSSASPPEYVPFLTIYNQGMELGAHSVNHICDTVDEATLRNQEWTPNIDAICEIFGGTQLCSQMPGLAWPCGFTNTAEQDISSEYFIASRGYNINQLEDQSPSNFQNLNSYNSHEHAPYPPSDLKTVVDLAEQQEKWANLVLHTSCNDDGAIAYATTKDIWGAPTSKAVVKYILQRDSFILNSYQALGDTITFSFNRLPIPPSPIRNFEDSFGPDDVITLKVDINDSRSVSSVRIDGVALDNKLYFTKSIGGNKFLFINTPIGTNPKTAEISYASATTPTIALNPSSLSFTMQGNQNSPTQTLTLSNGGGGNMDWSATVDSTSPAWLSVSPTSGTLSGGGNTPLTVTANGSGLAGGAYQKNITISAPGATNTLQTVNVSLSVCTYTLNSTSNSFSRSAGTGSIQVTASVSSCGWTAVSNVGWITITSGSSGTGNGTVAYRVSRNNIGNARTGTITVAGQTFTVTQSR